MGQEFTISKGMKIFYIAIAVFLFGFAMFLFSLDHSKAGPAVLLMPISLLVFAIIIVVNQVRSKVIISKYSVIKINAFSKKELLTVNIKGCRIGEKTISIEPASSSDSKIIINNYIDLSESEYLVKWLKENFKDLDSTDLKEEQKKILQDQGLGSTQAEREGKLAKAKQVALVYNILGMILGFALIFFKNTLFVAILMLAYPLLGIVIIIFSNGLIKFVSSKKRSVFSFIMPGLILPVFMMLIKSLAGYEISQYVHVWLPFIIFGLIIFVILFKSGVNNALPVTGQVFFMAIVGLLYDYGCTIQINCVFDKSEPQLIHAIVNDKWIEHSKGTYYHLKLNSWDLNQKPKDIEVSEEIYDKYVVGNNIDVFLKKGLLNIPWYYLPQLN